MTLTRSLEKSYQLHAAAYHKIFARCGLKFYRVESDPGMMGGAVSHEFMAPSPAGEDEAALCDKCGYAANVELAQSVPPKSSVKTGSFEEVHTPEKEQFRKYQNFLKLPPSYFIKSILVVADKTPVLALVRGDQDLHEKSLQRLLAVTGLHRKQRLKKFSALRQGSLAHEPEDKNHC